MLPTPPSQMHNLELLPCSTSASTAAAHRSTIAPSLLLSLTGAQTVRVKSVTFCHFRTWKFPLGHRVPLVAVCGSSCELFRKESREILSISAGLLASSEAQCASVFARMCVFLEQCVGGCVCRVGGRGVSGFLLCVRVEVMQMSQVGSSVGAADSGRVGLYAHARTHARTHTLAEEVRARCRSEWR